MDMLDYDAFMTGKLSHYELPQDDLQEFTKPLRDLPKAETRKGDKW